MMIKFIYSEKATKFCEIFMNFIEPLFFDLIHLEARAEIQKYFHSFFGANENFKNPLVIN